jgi:hypothetical protein
MSAFDPMIVSAHLDERFGSGVAEFLKAIGCRWPLWLVFGAFGSACFLGLRKRCSWRQMAVCWAFIASYAGIVLSNESRVDEIEWNPLDITDEEVIGTWSDGEETMVLGANGAFRYCGAGEDLAGRWTRDDWNLYLSPASNGGEMRLVRNKGQCRLMTHLPGDLDGWRYNEGLTRKPEPAREPPSK